MIAGVSRRWLLGAGPAALLVGCTSLAGEAAAIEQQLRQIRMRIGGRLGVYALDVHHGRQIAFAADARFAMASTFKLMLAAAVLAQVDRGKLALTQGLAFAQQDVVTYSPVTEPLLPRGHITLIDACKAIVEISDNTAANLLLRELGGPAALTRFMRTLGDRNTRLDRNEPALNSNLPGDPRDTTTPRSMVASMRKVLLGSVLQPASRELLSGWMVTSSTGLQRIRAALPPTWRAGDKTGTGANGAVNDLAILWPPQRQPILVAVYLSESALDTAALSAAHVQIGQLIVQQFA